MSKVIIAGGRGIDDADIVAKAVEMSGFDITEEVCGDAPGVDTQGKIWARKRGIPVKRFPAMWKDLTHPDAVIKQGKFGPYDARAGFRRNQDMADYADALIAVWDGHSTGTADMIARAEANGLKIYIYLIV